jgi:hypothetical protein
MKIIIRVCICFIVLITINGGCKSVMVTGKTPQKLEMLRQQCAISSDPEFADLLGRNKHNPHIVAPPAWRSLLVTLAPFRFDLTFGIVRNREDLKFFWFCGEFGTRGTPQEVLAAIQKLLRQKGFTARPVRHTEYGTDEYAFRKQENGLEHLLIVEGVERFVGSREPHCGGSLRYEISIPSAGTPPTVEEILAAFPELRCPELPQNLADFFKNRAFSLLSYGGTWTRYYSWQLDIGGDSASNTADLFKQVETIILGSGFSLEKTDRGVSVYQNPDLHEPIFYLRLDKNTAGNTVFSFRIQPHT